MTSQLPKMELIEDPGSIEPLSYEKLFLEKQYQIKIDPQRHLLYLPGEPALKDEQLFLRFLLLKLKFKMVNQIQYSN